MVDDKIDYLHNFVVVVVVVVVAVAGFECHRDRRHMEMDFVDFVVDFVVVEAMVLVVDGMEEVSLRLMSFLRSDGNCCRCRDTG